VQVDRAGRCPHLADLVCLGARDFVIGDYPLKRDGNRSRLARRLTIGQNGGGQHPCCFMQIRLPFSLLRQGHGPHRRKRAVAPECDVFHVSVFRMAPCCCCVSPSSCSSLSHRYGMIREWWAFLHTRAHARLITGTRTHRPGTHNQSKRRLEATRLANITPIGVEPDCAIGSSIPTSSLTMVGTDLGNPQNRT